ncbi:MAG: ABC transporter ATP-binding protein [Proteobacteria bacterium]|nr:ABC transporter ATP-binding protein [Pseudomonadota bacterium]
MAELLSLDGVVAGYGDSVILEDVSFRLMQGESLALLGRNGVGKTTLLLTLMGITRLHRGRMSWRGDDLTRLPAYRRAHAGLGWVPQERHVFPSLTVEEHLTVAARPGDWTVERVYETFPRLLERRRNFGNQLSGGERQMLAIGRALMVNPSLLLLDEPMEGLAPAIVQDFARVITRMTAETGVATIIVEQHARLALGLSKQALVLDRGRVVHRSDSQSLLADAATLDRLLSVKQ